MGEYAYLVGIALIALGIGAAAFAFSVNAQGMGMNPIASVADVRQPNRTIALQVSDQLRFAPDAVTVHVGDTIAFQVTNTGTMAHEVVIGDEAVQWAHEQEMVTGGGMAMGAEAAYVVPIPADQTATLVYTFSKPGTLIFGCHVVGHYGAGMRDTITVEQ